MMVVVPYMHDILLYDFNNATNMINNNNNNTL